MSIRKRLDTIIFGTDTPLGKSFDVGLLMVILLSVLIVMLESVPSLQGKYGSLFRNMEWVMTGIFTFEYLLRVWVTEKKAKYIFSFYGIIDLLSVLPTYISMILTGTQYLLIIRALRLLRVFRILKLGRFVGEGEQLGRALRASRHKITVFMGTVMMLVILLGTIMYLIEGVDNGFTSIPLSIYWAIVTLTTVGYGDIAPQTVLGQTIASFVMILGYAIIAVPTGIVTAEITREKNRLEEIKKCNTCDAIGHQGDAIYCRQCGERL